MSDLNPTSNASDVEATGRSRFPYHCTELLAVAHGHYEKAKTLIVETGYHRRDGELAEIEASVRTASGLHSQ